MSGKRIAVIFILMGCLVMSACSKAASSLPDQTNGEPVTTPSMNSPATLATPNDSQQGPLEYTQKVENLPDIKTLTTFPGVLESMSMTLEQIITVLGTKIDLQENKAQCYDSYYFPQYGIAYDFDKVSRKLSTIWLNQVPYYVHSGVFKTQDFNDDGNPEKIIAYEDQQYNGNLLVIDGETSAFSEVKQDFFGGKCEIEVLPKFGQNKENLILVNTHGENGGDTLSWSNGELKSILPQDYNKLSENTMVTVEGNKAVLVNEAKNILYVCPLPERVAKNINGRMDTNIHRFRLNLQSEKSSDSIVLKARTSLQLMLFDDCNFIGSTDGIFCDVAKVTQEYQYLGQGKWQEQKVDGGPKYENAKDGTIVHKDLSIGGLTLYDNYKAINKLITTDLSSYTPTELSEGVILKDDGLCFGITQGQITYLSLEEKSEKSTSKGLKLLDTREKVVSLYGLPDKGFMEDSIWTYYVVSEEKSENDPPVFVNTLNIEFDNEKVCRIWISAYVTTN